MKATLSDANMREACDALMLRVRWYNRRGYDFPKGLEEAARMFCWYLNLDFEAVLEHGMP